MIDMSEDIFENNNSKMTSFQNCKTRHIFSKASPEEQQDRVGVLVCMVWVSIQVLQLLTQP